MKAKICLLVDDDPDDQELFTSALADVSKTAQCIVVPDGERAIQMLHDRRNIPDLIFLDLNMPVMDGFQFLMVAKKDPFINTIPIIVYSTTDTPSQIEKSKKLGATDFITKSYRYADLCNLLKRYFGE